MSSELRLVLRARGGDQVAYEQLLARHGDLINVMARQYNVQGAERDDVLQEARIGLLKAIKDFRVGQGCTFRSFAGLCVERQVITALKSAARLKHRQLSRAVSLTAPAGDDVDGTLADVLPSTALGPAEQLAQAYEIRELFTGIQLDLSELEEAAVLGMVAGDSYEEIGAAHGVAVKTVDNALQRAKFKLAPRVGLARPLGRVAA